MGSTRAARRAGPSAAANPTEARVRPCEAAGTPRGSVADLGIEELQYTLRRVRGRREKWRQRHNLKQNGKELFLANHAATSPLLEQVHLVLLIWRFLR